MPRITSLVAAAAAALVTATLAPSPAYAAPQPSTGDNRIQVVQHNTDMGGIGPALGAAKDMGGVDAITFQELCAFRVADLEKQGYAVHWEEQRARTKFGCRKGNAIATVHPIAEKMTWQVFEGGGRTFKLLCVKLNGTGVARTTVCTSHLPLEYDKTDGLSGRDNRVKAANAIKEQLDALIANNRRVVMTGDFNDVPDSSPLSRFYSHNKGFGRFYEGDQTRRCDGVCRNMQPTTAPTKKHPRGRKLDYWFASNPGVSRNGLNKVVDASRDRTGHRVIRGSVVFGPLG